MVSGTLSQNEIDRLLTRPDALGAVSGASAHKVDAQLYDFRRPHRVSKERLRTLEAMYEQVVKSLEGWLLGRVRGQIELKLQSLEQLTFGEFTLSLSTPCAAYVFDIYGSEEHQGVLDFGTEFTAFLVDRLFGGSGKPVMPERALTPIERMAVKVVADRVVALLQDAWRDHLPLKMAVSGFETMPEFLRSASSDDAVMVATIEVATPEVSSLLLICLPFAVLDKFFASSRERRVNSTASPVEREASRELTESMVRATTVPVSARLPEFRLPLRELAQLRVGGIISTGIPTDVQLEIRVNGQPRFHAVPGRVGRRLAVSVSDELFSDAVLPSNPDSDR